MSSSSGQITPSKTPQGTTQASPGNAHLSNATSPPPPKQKIEIPDDYLKEPAPVMRRKDWGAKDPKCIEQLITPVKKVVITWTETDPCFTHEECKNVLRNIQESHMADPDVPDIKHHFMIGRDGAIYEGRSFMTKGPKYQVAEEKGYKLEGESLDIAFIEKCSSRPTNQLWDSLSQCLAYASTGEFVEDAIDIYWMSENEVYSVQPIKLEKTPDPDADKDSNLPNVKSSNLKFNMCSETMAESPELTEAPVSQPPKVKRCKVYTRKEWGGVSPSWTSAMPLPISKIVLSRTGTEPCFTFEECSKVVKQMQIDHMKEGAPDILYNFLVGGDGALYEGRGYRVVGPTYPPSPKGLQKLNRTSIDIALIELFSDESSDLMLKAVSDCITIGAVARYIENTFDMYWVADNEIHHVEYGLGEVKKKCITGDVGSNELNTDLDKGEKL